VDGGVGGVIMRSTDHGHTWHDVTGPLTAPVSVDPYMFIDPDTDRVFMINLYLACSYLSWSDDLGESWTDLMPLACGTPLNDHQKLGAGPVTKNGPLVGIAGTLYPNVLYYPTNSLVYTGSVAISIDGGQTWIEASVEVLGSGTECMAGLHGDPVTDDEGIVYVPHRSSCGNNDARGGPVIARSRDNGFAWDFTLVGDDVGTAGHDKNPAMATDSADNAYVAWPAQDGGLYFSASLDGGTSWSTTSRLISPVGTTTMPAMMAGDPGRVYVAYYGTVGQDEPAPDLVNETAHWHLYVTYSMNALDADPTWTTVRVTSDPIQVGAISTNSGDAPPGSRNLLDFIDMEKDTEGRVYVAYADGCTGPCADDPDIATPGMSRDAAGRVAILERGPSLYEDAGVLAPLSAPSA
jgi:hypothetical protein